MLKTAAVFSDNMVLQREKNISVFGETDSICVTVSFNGEKACAEIKNGKWMAILPPMNAGGPYSMTVTDGKDTVSFENVMIGEVWLAGGQSNMEYILENETHAKETLEYLEGNDKIRFYGVPRNAYFDDEYFKAENETSWQLAGKESSKLWSAVGVYFADRISKELDDVTVGIIGCNWGGTSASAWMSREYLDGVDEIHSYIEEYEKAIEGKTDAQMIQEYDEYTEYDKAWFEKSQKCYAENPNISWDEVQEICGKNLWPGPMGIKNPYRICGIYETML
ncbi:MAG: sialate O-acetylesterase, partial [Oscillospiraceae bacterium]|nr:sialate O-acetylesterase [Oscillospiraceae bacterium]